MKNLFKIGFLRTVLPTLAAMVVLLNVTIFFHYSAKDKKKSFVLPLDLRLCL